MGARKRDTLRNKVKQKQFFHSFIILSSLHTLLKVSKTTSPQNLFGYDCVTLYSVTKRKVLDRFSARLHSNINLYSISLILAWYIREWNHFSFRTIHIVICGHLFRLNVNILSTTLLLEKAKKNRAFIILYRFESKLFSKKCFRA